MARHHNVNVARDDTVARRAATGKRCKARTSTLASTSTSTSTQHSTSSHKATSTKKAAPTALTTNKDDNKSESSGGGNKPIGNVSGLIRITDSSCGSPGATQDITATHGPNGNIDWFNCGVDAGGWRPPMVTVDDVVTVPLDQAVKESGSPFKACAAYIDTFTKYANEHNIPPIIIASIAMQESSCNPHTVGGGGEQGLMQITKDKCGGAPGGNCQDIDYNIRTGVAFFANTLKENGGSLLKTIGNYNGWPDKMTIASATAAQHSDCCLCMNNLDYLQQTMNGWFLNKDPYKAHMGKYFNLDVCPGRG
ncbi:lysozyme-like protein [Lentinus brumalis]|uniref:Lysozyme-like protein n=1 Tax=Lentinus brumalis TaxID=2498619 RepID=A0A371DRC5_9APHY|nr:lysozyme-like protein [Polyporus brumalis]